MTVAASKVLVVESRYYPNIADSLLDGAIDALRAASADWDVISLPGVLEIPPAIAMAEEAGRAADAVPYDGYVALACVLNDEMFGAGNLIDHASSALLDLSVSLKLAIGQGLVRVDSEADGVRWARDGDGGGGAARACLELMALRARLLGI